MRFFSHLAQKHVA